MVSMLVRKRLYHCTRCVLTENNAVNLSHPSKPEPSLVSPNSSIDPSLSRISLLMSTIPKVPYRNWGSKNRIGSPSNSKKEEDNSKNQEVYDRIFRNDVKEHLVKRMRGGHARWPPVPNPGIPLLIGWFGLMSRCCTLHY